MSFIKKIFSEKTDDSVHTQFVRFSIGDYYPRAAMKIKTGNVIKFSSGFEYGNDFVRFIAENVTGEVDVSGKIYAKKDFTSELVDSKEKKKGFFIGLVSRKMPAKDLVKIINTFDADTYFLLNVKSNDAELKISQSPHNPRGKYKEDFCKFIVKGDLAKKAFAEFAFDVPGMAKEILIKHRFLIDDVQIPKEFEKDLVLARIMARRVGKVVRELTYDGKEEKKEVKLNA